MLSNNYEFEVRTDLIKYQKMNGYKAEAQSYPHFLQHLKYRFNLSRFELDKAIKQHKIIVLTLRVVYEQK